MLGIPISFKLERKSILPILTVTGVSKPISGVERFMISKSVEMIEKAQKFKGKPMELNGNEDLSDLPKGMVTVRFYLIFKNEDKLESYMRGMER